MWKFMGGWILSEGTVAMVSTKAPHCCLCKYSMWHINWMVWIGNLLAANSLALYLVVHRRLEKLFWYPSSHHLCQKIQPCKTYNIFNFHQTRFSIIKNKQLDSAYMWETLTHALWWPWRSWVRCWGQRRPCIPAGWCCPGLGCWGSPSGCTCWVEPESWSDDAQPCPKYP